MTLKHFYEIVEDLANTQRDAERDIRRGFHLMSKDGRCVTEVNSAHAPTRAREREREIESTSGNRLLCSVAARGTSS